MNKDEIMNYWIITAEDDYKTMLHLYESGDYHWCLFMGHLVIEKLLKALFVKNASLDILKTHDLLKIAKLAQLELDEEKSDLLDLITAFNISARYPHYKRAFYKKCTREYTSEIIEKIKDLKKWLLSQLKNQ